MGQMRILHVLSSRIFSGAENVICQIIEMFREEESVQMVYVSPDGDIARVLRQRNIDYFPLTDLTPGALRRAIRALKPTMIHAHDMRASLVTALVCGEIPFVSHIHNNSFASRGLTPKAVAYLYAAKRASHIFWVSPSACRGYRFQKAIAGKSTVLRNVLDAAALRERAACAQERTGYDIVFLGRLSHPKNPTRLVEVMAAVGRARPGTQCALIGAGELEPQVRAAIAAQDCGAYVHLLGFRENPYGLLEHAQLMLMTSLWEGTPMCALEAMALGVPIVSTPTDGLVDLVEPGVTGYLSGDNGGLVEGCLQLLRNSELRAQMSRRSREKADALLDLQRYKQTLWQAYCQGQKGDG